MSWPWLLTLNDWLLKFAAAEAVVAPNASKPVTAIAKIARRRIFPSLGIKRFFRRNQLGCLVVGSPLVGELRRRKNSAPRAPVHSGAKHHLPSRRLKRRRGMRGRCNGPIPRGHVGWGLFRAAKNRSSRQVRPSAWECAGRHRRSTCGFSLHPRPNCKQRKLQDSTKNSAKSALYRLLGAGK